MWGAATRRYPTAGRRHERNGMRIGILGTGEMGRALAAAWAKAGHSVFFGSRSPARAVELAASTGHGARGGSVSDAAAFGDCIVLAVPWQAVESTLENCGTLAGKVLIDCTNPIDQESGELVELGTDSGSRQIAAWAVDATLVKTLNTIPASLLTAGISSSQEERPTVFLCGDDDSAATIVSQLIEDLGCTPVPTGGLDDAKHLEHLGALLVKLGRSYGADVDIALRLLRRPTRPEE